MKAERTPFERAWWSFGLGKYRPCNGTYCYYDFDSIPPLDNTQFTGKFDWLTPLVEENDWVSLVKPNDLKRVQASAKKLNLTLPSAFLNFMQNTTLQNRIPSCTACEFGTSDIIPDPLQDKYFYIPFLYDQQAVVNWYLYINTDNDYCVVASLFLLDDLEEDITPEHIKQNTYYCVETFEAFIYRFWIENIIWFAIHADPPQKLTPSQKSYLRHYQKP